MIQLYPYQQTAIDEIKLSFSQGLKSVLLCSPTGSGKTVMFSYIVANAINKCKKCLILTDRIELLKGTGSTLENFGIIQEYLHKKNYVSWDGCTIAMSQTLKRRPELFEKVKQCDLVICDEAHKLEFDYFFNEGLFCNYVIGCTATPLRKGKQKELAEQYKKIIYTKSVLDLIKDRFLIPAKSYAFGKIDFDKCKIKNSDYDEKEQVILLSHDEVVNGLIENYNRICPDTITLVFCINIEHTIETARKVGARYITSEMTEKERENTLQDWYAGKFKVLCNCGIFTTGFDFPAIETIILNRATKSENLFLQMCGRGSRIFSGKNHFNILDLGGNIERHGHWEKERIYSLLHKKKSIEGEGVAAVKECGIIKGKKIGGCGALIPARAKICEYCGFEYPDTTIEIDGEIIQLELISYSKINGNKSVSVLELEKYRVSKKYKQGWILFQLKFRNNFDEELRQYAEIMKYSKGWIYMTKKRLGLL